jgi:hypothetical protein
MTARSALSVSPTSWFAALAKAWHPANFAVAVLGCAPTVERGSGDSLQAGLQGQHRRVENQVVQRGVLGVAPVEPLEVGGSDPVDVPQPVPCLGFTHPLLSHDPLHSSCGRAVQTNVECVGARSEDNCSSTSEDHSARAGGQLPQQRFGGLSDGVIIDGEGAFEADYPEVSRIAVQGKEGADERPLCLLVVGQHRVERNSQAMRNLEWDRPVEKG